MKRILILFIITVVLFSGCKQNIEYNPYTESPQLNLKGDTDNIYGVWFSYLEFDELLCAKSESEFRTVFQEVVSNCKSIGINAMFIQVRSHADAYYKSKLFPMSRHICGEFNGNLSYDPLKIMVEICHNYGIKIHAWINPYRAYNQEEMDNISVENRIKQWYNEDKNVFFSNGRYYLSPACDEVISFVNEGVKEILAYNVDGIHFDDYFYASTDAEIDEYEFIKSGYDDLQKFRLDCVSRLVSTVYSTVKDYNDDVAFGVSPQGNINNNYSSQYADVRRWCSEEGFIDYIAPQIYYGFNNSTAPFDATVKNWQDIITLPNVKLIIGLAAYKIGKEDANAGNGSNEWIADEHILSRQISESSKMQNYNGVIFYRYGSLFINENEKIKNEIDTFKSIIN